MHNIDKLISSYISLREKRQELTRKYESQIAEIQQQLDAIEQELARILHESGLTSIKSPHGTAYSTETTKAYVSDWSAFADFLVGRNPLEFLEQRIKTSAVVDYLNATGDLPSGVSLARNIAVRIRRS